jgi:catechol 2,3-dioxygenase-like lactoylglutathione lyase family enzyme
MGTVNRIGHMGLRVRDLDRAVEFHRDVLGLVETERVGDVAYLTCNERHHELILIAAGKPGYDHIGLEVADTTVLEQAQTAIERAGGKSLGPIYDGEPGIDRALRCEAPGGHVFKLFCGMKQVGAPAGDDLPVKFEHASIKSRSLGAIECFLKEGLGFRFSDRMGRLASWWHCDADHHGMAIVFAPRPELSHYAFTVSDFGQLSKIADRLAARGQKLLWGPSRHGPGNNHFIYFHDADGAMIECCSEIAKMPPEGNYQPRTWPSRGSANQWGGGPPARFILTGYPISPSPSGRPEWIA